MEKLGLIVDSLQIQEIDDPTGYIQNLGRPHAAAVASLARIAQAQADREATQQEQQAEALKAEARRNSEIKQAGFQAEIDEAAAKAQQAGPLASASARQQVVVQETSVAQLEAEREEQRLLTTVRKPADAQAYQQVTLAKAERDARIAGAEAQRQEVELQAAGNAQRVKVTADADAEQVRLTAGAEADRIRLQAGAQAESVKAIGEAEASATQAKGLAEGQAVRAKGMAEAEAIKARADALAENQEAVIGQQLAEQWPAIVEAAAKPFGNIDQMIVLNGAQGVSEALAQALSQGVAGLQLARNLLAGGHTLAQPDNGKRDAATAVALTAEPNGPAAS
jgi:flotillin